jgi:hypothetical protein
MRPPGVRPVSNVQTASFGCQRAQVGSASKNLPRQSLAAGLPAQKYDRWQVFLELFPGFRGNLSITLKFSSNSPSRKACVPKKCRLLQMNRWHAICCTINNAWLVWIGFDQPEDKRGLSPWVRRVLEARFSPLASEGGRIATTLRLPNPVIVDEGR